MGAQAPTHRLSDVLLREKDMIITTTIDTEHWQVVPKVLTNEMWEVGEVECVLGDDFKDAYEAALAAAPPAPSAGLDDLAKFIATNYPMAAIIRALDRAAPGIRHAFSPPRAARIWPQAGGKVES